MSIDCHSRHVVDNGSNNIGSFSTNTRQSLEFINIGRHYVIKLLYQNFCHSNQMLCFVVWITDTANVREHFLRTGSGQGGIREEGG